MEPAVPALRRQQLPPSSFHFPKWYTDYVAAGSGRVPPQSRRQTFRLTFLHQDGTGAGPAEEARGPLRDSATAPGSQAQFPVLRVTRTLPDGFADAPRSRRPQPLPTVVPLSKPLFQQGRNLPALERYNNNNRSFVAGAGTVPAHPALYSSIRVAHGGARLRSWQQHAVETIPSVESIRQSIRLPPILIKKLG